MSALIREASNADIPVLAELIRESFADVASRFGLTPENCPSHPSNCIPDWIERALSKGARYFILDAPGPFGCVAMESASADSCYLERLAVLPKHRRKGFGRALVHQVFDEARRTGLSRVEIAIIEEHTDLRTWYESLGFSVTRHAKFEHLPFGVAFMQWQVQ